MVEKGRTGGSEGRAAAWLLLGRETPGSAEGPFRGLLTEAGRWEVCQGAAGWDRWAERRWLVEVPPVLDEPAFEAWFAKMRSAGGLDPREPRRAKWSGWWGVRTKKCGVPSSRNYALKLFFKTELCPTKRSVSVPTAKEIEARRAARTSLSC